MEWEEKGWILVNSLNLQRSLQVPMTSSPWSYQDLLPQVKGRAWGLGGEGTAPRVAKIQDGHGRSLGQPGQETHPGDGVYSLLQGEVRVDAVPQIMGTLCTFGWKLRWSFFLYDVLIKNLSYKMIVLMFIIHILLLCFITRERGAGFPGEGIGSHVFFET